MTDGAGAVRQPCHWHARWHAAAFRRCRARARDRRVATVARLKNVLRRASRAIRVQMQRTPLPSVRVTTHAGHSKYCSTKRASPSRRAKDARSSQFGTARCDPFQAHHGCRRPSHDPQPSLRRPTRHLHVRLRQPPHSVRKCGAPTSCVRIRFPGRRAVHAIRAGRSRGTRAANDG